MKPSGVIYRMGRVPDPWGVPDWASAGPDGTFGNRFDDPDATYRVLYASSQRLGCFLETFFTKQVLKQLTRRANRNPRERHRHAHFSGSQDRVPPIRNFRHWQVLNVPAFCKCSAGTIITGLRLVCYPVSNASIAVICQAHFHPPVQRSAVRGCIVGHGMSWAKALWLQTG